MSWKHLYYNQASYDGRRDHGYGKAQDVPSTGTGTGSERALSSNYGIYPAPPRYDTSDEELDDFYEDTFDYDFHDLDTLVAKINQMYTRVDPSRRADRASFVSNQRIDLAPMAEKKMPGVSSGIAPFSHRALYPGGFSGPPMGTGNAGQAFRTTGPSRKTGTYYGTSRAPTVYLDDEPQQAFRLEDILDDDNRALIRQRIKILRILADLDDDDAIARIA